MTKEELEEYLNELFDSKIDKERQFKFWRGCKTYGMIEGFFHCGNETCENCNQFSKMLKEEIKKSLDDYEKDM